MLLEHDDINVNHTSNYGCTALLIAAGEGHVKIVEMLLKKEDIELNVQDYDYGDTALLVAASMGHHHVVRMLLKEENIEVNLANWAGDTPLLVAADKRNGEVVNLLLGTEAKRAIGWNGWRPIADAA